MSARLLFTKEASDVLVKLALESAKRKQERVLYSAIQQKSDLLETNPHAGIQIAKKKIPREYIRQYDVDNLWKVNLPNAWRMLYTIRGGRIEVIALVLDVLSHKDYEKKMKY